MARLAMPPGHDPMPEACTSVPRTGSDGSPVKTTSKNTVPFTNRSNVVVGHLPSSGSALAAGSVRWVRVTILGGGGFRVPLIARQLAASGLPVARLALYDTDPGRLAVIAGVLGGDPATRGLPVTVATELDAALRGPTSSSRRCGRAGSTAGSATSGPRWPGRARPGDGRRRRPAQRRPHGAGGRRDRAADRPSSRRTRGSSR